MRVLQINSSISINSGVMSVIMNYYRHIDRKQIQFDFAYYNDPTNAKYTYIDEITQLEGNVFRITSPREIKQFKRELLELIKKQSYEIAQIHDAFLMRFIYRDLKKAGIKKVIVHSHATKWSDKMISAIRNRVLCMNIMKYSDIQFACSKAAGQFLYRNDVFTVINNAIDTYRYKFDINFRNSIRKKYNLDNQIVVGHVGNFTYQKNHEYLLKLFYSIHKLNNNTVLMLVGDGQLKQNIERMTDELGLVDNVIFVGTVEDVEKYYSAMDMFVLPSLYEGLPMAGVEAQCSGLKCFFSDTITEEINIMNAEFFPLKEDPFILAKHILESDRFSPSERNNGKKLVADHSFDITVEAKKLMDRYMSYKVERIVE